MTLGDGVFIFPRVISAVF